MGRKIVTAVVALAAWAAVLTETTACRQAASEAVVKVPASQSWADTGLAVDKGRTFSIVASGRVWANAALSYGPEGEPNRPEWKQYSLIPEAPHLGLIAKVGEDGTPFFVGAAYEAPSTATGRLFLGVNDRDVANNRGEFTATVSAR